MSTFKRTMCMLLSLVMVLGMFPVSAFATDAGLEVPVTEPVITEVVPEIAPVMPEVIPAPVPEIIPEPVPEVVPVPDVVPEIPEVPVEPVVPEVIPTEVPVEVPVVTEAPVIPTEEPVVAPAPVVEPVAVYFNCSPAELSLYVYDAYGVPVMPSGIDGGYLLMPGSYSYSAYAEGYVGVDYIPFTVVEGVGNMFIDVVLQALVEEAVPEAGDEMVVMGSVEASFYKSTVTSGTCGDNAAWTLSDSGLLTISGSGKMKDYAPYGYHQTFAPWYDMASDIKYVRVEEGITIIGAGAFDRCENVKWVDIPSTVTCIESNAFYKCSSLEDVYIYDLKAWCKITFNSNPLTYADNLYLNEDNKLTDIDFQNINEISLQSFSYFSGLESITLHGNINGGSSRTYIHSNAFSNCANLKSIYFTSDASGYTLNTNCFKDVTATAYVPCDSTGWSESSFAETGGTISLKKFHTEVVDEAVAPTCTETGLTEGSHCSGCGMVLVAQEVVPAAHTGIVTDEAVPPTCTETGLTEGSHCEDCGEVIVVQEIVAPTHTEEIIEGVPPTCTESGITDGIKCSACGEVLKEQVVAPPAHTEVIDEAVEATCLNTGLTEGKHCSACGEILIEQETLPITDHSYTEIPNGAKICDVCCIAIGNCGDNLKWELKKGCLTISGAGAMKDYATYNDSCTVPWFGLSIKSVVIESGVTSIGDCAFYNCTELSDISIPDTVTSVGKDAFYRCSSLRSIVIPDSVNFIGDSAFYSCNSLSSVTIPNGVSYIAPWAFAYCLKLASVMIPDSVVSVADSAFYYCNSLSKVNIPNQVTRIGSYAFYYCTSLGEITIGSSVETIERSAFEGCTGLKVIHIPVSVKKIDYNVFKDCSALKAIHFGHTHNDELDIAYSAFYLYSSSSLYTSIYVPYSHIINSEITGYDWSDYHRTVTYYGGAINGGSCGDELMWLLSNDGTLTVSGEGDMYSYSSGNAPWYIHRDTITSIVIEEGVRGISNSAFENYTNLESADIPGSIASVGDKAFSGCYNLTISYEGTLSRWLFLYSSDNSGGIICSDATACDYGSCGDDAYWAYCENGVLRILGSGAISNYSKVSYVDSSTAPWGKYDYQISRIIIDSGISKIGSYAFYGFYNLDSVNIPDLVNSIGEYAFSGCKELTGVAIPDSVTNIEDGTFSDCSNLSRISIPDSVTSIGNNAFYGCSNLSSITIPVSVTSIGDRTFYNCSKLSNVNIPNGVISIGEYAFSGCKELTGVAIPNSVTSVGDSAFYGCSNLHIITIGSRVSSIGNSVFYDCSKLSSVTIPDSVTKIGEMAFYGCSGLESVNIGNSVTSIGSNAFENCTNLQNVNITDLAAWCAINFSNPQANPTYHAKSLKLNGKALTELVIPDTVSSIGSYVFCNCSSFDVVNVPYSVTKISTEAFSGCSNDITMVYGGPIAKWLSIYPVINGGKVICSDARVEVYGKYGNNLRWYLDESGKLCISGSGAMSSSTAPWANLGSQIKSVEIAYGITEISSSAFYGFASLSEVSIPNSVVKIGDSAFYGCSGLKEISLPSELSLIGSSAFYGCSGISSITIPAGVSSIGSSAFYGCSGITEITIPEGLSSIGSNAFSGCTALSHVTFVGGNVQIGENAFSGVAAKVTYYCTSMKDANGSNFGGSLTWKEVHAPSGNSCSRCGLGRCGDNVYWDYDDIFSSLHIRGEGAMYDYNFSNVPWMMYCNKIKLVSVDAGVTHIGSFAFSGIPNLIIMSPPESVTSIGAYAFYKTPCAISIPASVTKIGDKALYGTKTVSFDGPAVDWLAMGCSDVSMLFVDDSKEILYYGGKCGENVHWGYGVDTEAYVRVLHLGGSGSTYDCTTQEDVLDLWGEQKYNVFLVEVGEGITRLGNMLFSFMINTPFFDLPSTLTEIGKSTFDNCWELSSIYIPANVTSIGERAFWFCDKLDLISFEHQSSDPLKIGNEAFRILKDVQTTIKVTDAAHIHTAISAYDWEGNNRIITYSSEYCSHTEVTDEAVGATCAQAGLTEGSHCSTCGTVFVEQEIIPVVPHELEYHEADYEICFGGYKEAYYECIFCGQAFVDENASEPAEFIEGTGGHKKIKVNVPAVAATDTETGLKAYTITQCETCEAKFKADGSVYTDAEWEAYLETLTVYAKAKSVTLSNELGEITSGSTVAVEMTEFPQVQLSAEVAPIAAKRDVKWKSMSTAIATVDADGVVTFLKPGAVVITATAADGSNKSASVKFDVNYAGYASNVKFTAKLADMSTGFGGNGIPSATNIGLQEGDSVQLNLFGLDKTAPIADLSAFKFSVSAGENYAEIDSNGIITAKGVGSATVKAELAGDPLKRSVSVTVKTIRQQLGKVDIAPSDESDSRFVSVDINGQPCAETGLEHAGYILMLDMAAKGSAAQTITVLPEAIGSSGDPVELSKLKGQLTWASNATGIVTVKENADGSAALTIKSGVDGLATITATSKDSAKAQGSLKINVRDFTPRLEAATATLDSQKGLPVSLGITTSYENTILGLSFQEYDTKSKIYYDSDRISAAYIQQADAELDGFVEHVVLSAKSYLKNQTVKGQLLVKTVKGDYPLPLSVTVKNTAPAVTAKQLTKFNLFYTDSVAEMTVSVKNELITGVWLEGTDFVGTWDGEKLNVSFKAPNAKPNAKVTMYISLAGYSYPVEKAVTIGTETKKPNIGLEAASGTANFLYGSGDVALRIMDKTSKAYQDISELSIWADIGCEIGKADSYSFELINNGAAFFTKGGKVNLSVQGANWVSPIVLAYTLKVNTTLPTLKPKAATLTLNSLFEGMSASTEAVLSQANVQGLHIEDAELTPAKADFADCLSVRFEDGQFVAELLDSSIKAGSYAYSFVPRCGSVELATVKLTVKVVNTQPTAKLSKTSVTVNKNFVGQEAQLQLVPTDASHKVYDFDAVIKAKEGTDAYTQSEKITIVEDFEEAGLIYAIVTDGSVKPGTYSYTINAKLGNDAAKADMKPLTLSVKVVDTMPKVTLSAASMSLNTVLADTEQASIELNCADNRYSVIGYKVDRTDTKTALDNSLLIDVSGTGEDGSAGNVITAKLDASNLPKAATYKFAVTPRIMDNVTGEEANIKAINFTVKVYANAKYSATVSASGKLDAVVREDSAITYTLTKLSNVVGNVVDVNISGQDAELFDIQLGAPNAKGQPTAVLKLLSDATYSTAKTYKLQLDFTLDSGIVVSTAALSVKVASTALKLSGTPKVVNVYQSQSRTRIVYYNVSVTSPVGAGIERIELGKLTAQQQEFAELSKPYFTFNSDGSVTVKLLIRDTGKLGINKSYTLPLEIYAAGQATSTPVKLSLSVKVLK